MVTIRDSYVLEILLVLVLESRSSFGYWRLSESTNGTIVSPSHIFELGLFRQESPYYRTRWYLAIWYKRFPRSPVWIANIDNPLSDSIGILKIYNSNLLLLNQSGGHVWETNLTINGAMSLVAELLDTGNFVLKYSDNNGRISNGFLWQTFHYPTDTLLPGMNLTWNIGTEPRILRSWAYEDDPSSGYFTYQLEGELGLIESEIQMDGTTMFRIDPSFIAKFGYIESEIRPGYISTNYTLQMIKKSSYYAALKLSYEGTLSYFEWTLADGDWKEIWKVPSEECDAFEFCGDNSYCSMNPQSSCTCLDGFRPLNFHESDQDHSLEKGCRRKSYLTCKDGFRGLKNTKLPFMDRGTIVQTNVEFEKCRQICLERCSDCTAFASIDIPNGGWSCVMWTGNLMDVRRYNNTDQGQDLYVKLTARDIGERIKIIGFTFGASILLLISVVMLYFWQRNKITAFFVSREISIIRNETSGNWKSAFMEFDVIAQATNNFSDDTKIGTGGFGNVYKGRLLDGQEIAVKRLYMQSDEAIQGYFNEVNLIAVLQHVNLVRLLGYFHNDNEKILVYEFIENSSLDTYLFDTTRTSMLSWDTRFNITKGIARGLLYLHQDSRFRIIHLDLKASNILLGKHMVPKISDFGMAKILEGGATEAVASHLAGTIGYMPPEYTSEKIYSVKSDVFSFGVLLLEIVSGMKTTEFSRLSNGQSFLSFIWRSWSVGKGLEIVDPVIKEFASSYRPEQVLRCIQIGLLCVQGHAKDRPTMASIIFMLGSEIELIDLPKAPLETCSSSSLETTSTMPMSNIVAR